MDIYKAMDNWRLVSIKHGYQFMDIYYLRISIAECPCMDIRALISMWISSLVCIIEDWHPKIMDIHVDIRGFLEIHAWICCGFSDQGSLGTRTKITGYCIGKEGREMAISPHPSSTSLPLKFSQWWVNTWRTPHRMGGLVTQRNTFGFECRRANNMQKATNRRCSV